MTKAFIFNLDNTLIKTNECYMEQVVKETLLGLGLDYKQGYGVLFWCGSNRDEIIKNNFGASINEFYQLFGELDKPKTRVSNCSVYEDVNVLKKIQQLYHTAIVTGAPSFISELEIALLDGLEFNCIINANPLDRCKAKPDPEGLIKCLDYLRVKPSEAVYVGDLEEDVIAAQRAGVFDVHLERRKTRMSVTPTMIIPNLSWLPY